MNAQFRTVHLALAMAALLVLETGGHAQPPVVLPPARLPTNSVTHRQAVERLLRQANDAYRGPVSLAGMSPDVLRLIRQNLLEASALEPYRVDLLFSAANACIGTRDIDEAIKQYRKVLDIAPDEIDAHTYLAAWLRCRGEKDSDQHLSALERLDSGRAAKLANAFRVIDEVTKLPLREHLPESEAKAFTGPVAIVTLGHVLNPDGTMQDILIKRLEKTLELAIQLPDALIVVTGGVPQNNQTEGELMTKWLVAHGVAASRIYDDHFARTTIENALYSRYALARHRIRHAVLVSSASHERRALAIYKVAMWETGPADLQFVPIVTSDKAQSKTMSQSELRGIYRDVLRTMGLWHFRSYPLEDR